MMTVEQFEEEKTRLATLYGHEARAASAKRAQAFARLYVASGWTIRSLAETEKFSHTRINQLVHFGKFMMYLETQGFHDCDMHEKQFRMMWNTTDTTHTDTIRFVAVLQQWKGQTSEGSQCTNMKGLGKKIIAQFSDGKFHRLRDMADALEAEMPAIRGISDRIVTKGIFQTFGERRPAPPKDGSYAYRFVKGGKKKIDLMAFSSEVQPVLDDMQMILNGPRKTDFSREAMQTAFAQLLKVLDSVAR